MWLLGKVTRAPGDGFVPSGSRAERGPERGGNTNIVSASAPAPRAGDEYVSLYTAHTRGPGCAGMENRVSGINDIENDREQIGNGFARPTRGDGNVPHSYLPSPAPHLHPTLHRLRGPRTTRTRSLIPPAAPRDGTYVGYTCAQRKGASTKSQPLMTFDLGL